MRIVFIGPQIYDYMASSIVEGLTELGHHLVCSETSNGGVGVSDSELLSEAEKADLIVLGSNLGVRHQLLQHITNPRLVCYDGGDFGHLEVLNTVRFKAVFKRELCKADTGAASRHIYPLPLAAERRYFTPPTRKDILASFLATMQTNPIRNSIYVRMSMLRHPAVVAGTTNERSYDVGAPSGQAIETPIYRQLLARSLISVSAAGAGYDCGRYWEIPAAGAMLLAYSPDIIIPNGFTDGVNCATFSSLDEFDSKLAYYMANPQYAAQIAAQGQAHLRAYHTSARRADYFLKQALQAVARPDYCADFLHPEIRALEAVCVGRGLDVGCGSNKTTPNCIGVDLTAQGDLGSVGSQAGQISVAEITTSGDNLSMFADNELDFVVARHNLEHYHDPKKTLAEWRRVIRPGGRIGVIVPDHDVVDTYALDPTHYVHFTMNSFRDMVGEIGGLSVDQIGVCVPNWSFQAVMTKTTA